ncbi:MAG: peptidase domain-containing ABC transporter [Balneolaceae bacterium]|nr:MAG: peptidase domain-containing ABC transporter [Balneolaceae bacterium]
MRRRKIEIRQHDITDCGAACLASAAAHFGLELPISRIRQYASTDQKGTNILGMIEAAEKVGLSARGVRGEYEALYEIPRPAIAHVVVKEVLHHFVVIYEVDKQFVTVMDPMDGKLRKVPHEEFREQWTGVLILLMPDPSFRPGNEKVSLAARLWFLLKPHRKVLLQALAGAAVYTLLGLSGALYVQFIVDHVLAEGNRSLLNLLGIGMIAILLFQIVIGVTKTIFTLKTGQLIDARLILGYYKHLLKLPQQFFDTMRVGEIISRINDAVKIRAFINDVAINIVVNLFIVLFSFGLMFTYYWKLGLIMLAILPVYTLVYLITNQINKKTQRRLMEQAADLESQLVESLNSVSTIKQFGLEEFANIKTETRFIALLKTVYRSGLNALFSGNASMFTSRMFTIILLWSGSAFVLQGHLTPGELLSFYAILGYFTGPVSELVEMNRTIQDALIAADRLFEIMDLDQEEEGRRVELKKEHIGDIQFRDVHFRYGSRADVFEGLNLVIPAGKVTAFVGESGSGKTTLVNILQKLYPVESGTITIGELNLAHIETGSLRRLTGTVPQKTDLFSGNVIENIAVGETEPDMEKVITICRRLGILKFIEELPGGFGSWLGENGAVLSGGQKQRIAIARALYRDPEVLILDEATSSLDSASEQYVQDAVSWMKSRGKTVILIAHRLSTVFMADKICVLENGKLTEEGSHEELMRRKAGYYRLWKKQFPFLNGELDEVLKAEVSA